jgi:hypothetical protein
MEINGKTTQKQNNIKITAIIIPKMLDLTKGLRPPPKK